MMRATILTVLRSGGEFTPHHVRRLYDQCDGHPFLCLTDMEVDTPHCRLEHGWRGWFSKLEMFRFPGPILYMDLDTTVLGDIAPLLDVAEQREFVALKNPLPTYSRLNSAMMSWNGDLSHIYRRFAEDSDTHMRRCTTQRTWGDQGFIAEDMTAPVFWQDLFPGQIVSWKVDCKAGVPKDARVVYFHGQPRPWDVGM